MLTSLFGTLMNSIFPLIMQFIFSVLFGDTSTN